MLVVAELNVAVPVRVVLPETVREETVAVASVVAPLTLKLEVMVLAPETSDCR